MATTTTTAAVRAVETEEWLAAARRSLGLADDADLRLLGVTAKAQDGSDDVQGFLGDTQAVRVHVQEGAEGDDHWLAMFLKAVPTGNAVREALAVDTRVFHKESDFFELVERLTSRLRSGSLQAWAPRCLLHQPRLLLFEDLGVQGFSTLGLRSTLDFAHCAAALDAVARLHAASLALEETDRRARGLNPWRLGDRFREPLHEVIFTDVPNLLSKYFLASLLTTKTIVSLMPEYKDSPRYNEILKKLDRLPQFVYDVVKPSKKFRNVICHGDLWVNNIMFRKQWEQVAEARLVDFQLTRYAPPALDVEMLLHLCARRALRDARGHELRSAYYDALEKALAAAGMNAHELLPRAEFEASCRWGAMFGRIVTMTYFPGDLLPADVIRDIFDDSSDGLESYMVGDRSALVRDAWARDAEYRERISECTSELVENLLLADNGPL